MSRKGKRKTKGGGRRNRNRPECDWCFDPVAPLRRNGRPSCVDCVRLPPDKAEAALVEACRIRREERAQQV